ncbi:MAG: MarR family transcriptional regulator, partial [Pseudomonadota bacterium]
SLEAKGLLKIKSLDHNNKDKCIALTELGEECYEKSLSLKAELEARICEKVGAEQLTLLKSVLKSDWGL